MQLRPVAPTDHSAVLAVLATAFADDPIATWLFGGTCRRPELQERFYRHQLGHPAARTDIVDDGDGVAIWHHLAGPEPAASTDLSAVFGTAGLRLQALGEVLAPHHPAEPHAYLFCMAVTGRRQGAGLGSALLRHRLRLLDQDGVPAYLEASSARSRALYLRHGFEDLAGPVHPAGGPPLWPMGRNPRQHS
ncbi:GNAT family N-acetyltransferase [Kribbella speibonae]|uniref:GNAT family N-acetyltransferase n=1 Tax=Kribbella speibonae TaxID=1572660 RepID=A0A4R0IKS2_9ACTN|nr:GNAT family N-acetyltransferase [Kribbella speibonae]TCC34111.1 GNAT family N-acetyltransferase [Kribbella speibonae]